MSPGRFKRFLRHPVPWLGVAFIGFFILVGGAAAFLFPGTSVAPVQCSELICGGHISGWVLYGLGVGCLVVGVAGYWLNQTPDRRDRPR